MGEDEVLIGAGETMGHLHSPQVPAPSHFPLMLPTEQAVPRSAGR